MLISAEKDSPPHVIAELSANHLGSLDRALTLVKEAQKAGASFVKFQHFTPDLISVKGSHQQLRVDGGTLWDGLHLWDLYQAAMMPWEWTAELVQCAAEAGIGWLSSPFDESAVDFLEQFDPPAYKVSSFEIVDLPLIRHVAATGKPLVISTGMATMKEISLAVDAATVAGAKSVTLLRTNSGYPAPTAEMDLRAIPEMQKTWGLPVGLSDHTLDSTAAIVATALGARVFEKHMTLRRSDGGPDAAFSVEPDEMKLYVETINKAHSSLGQVRFGPSKGEEKSLKFRPSVRATADIEEGEELTTENVASVRPAGGMLPDQLSEALGSKARVRIDKGDPITWNVISEKSEPPKDSR